MCISTLSHVQINEVAQEKGINILFAVKENNDVYKKLSERIKDSFFGQLEESSTNVIDIVTKVYQVSWRDSG